MGDSLESMFVHEGHEGTRRKTFDKDASPMRPYCVLRGYFHPNADERQFMGNS